MPRLLDGFELSRRRWLQAGGLGMLGLGLSDLARLRSAPVLSAAQNNGRRRSCVFLFLFGGPSHIDLWDMKPDAPEIVRGEFTPIDTNVPGIQVCEHLPRFARVMDKVCLLRSTTHRMNVHGPACSEVFTGREYFGPPTTDQATREDWPSLSSLMARFGQGAAGMPPSVVLPWYLQFTGQSKRIAGQTGGRMGEQHNAFLLQGEVERADFEMEGLRVTDDVPMNRIDRRRNLLGRIERSDARLANVSTATFDGHTQSAFDLLANRVGERSICGGNRLRRASVTERRRPGKAFCSHAGSSKRASDWSL